MSNSMKAANNKTRQRLSPLLVRCICVTSSLIVMAAGLVAMGTTCLAIVAVDPDSAPCPQNLVITVFGVAGGLFLVSFVLLLQLCRRRTQLQRQMRMGDGSGESSDHMMTGPDKRNGVRVNGGVEEVMMKKKTVVGGDSDDEKVPVTPDATEEVNNFGMTQKSADVSHWIEQQGSAENNKESFSIEIEDGATGLASDEASDSEGEMTSL